VKRANARLRDAGDPRRADDGDAELAFVEAYRDTVLRRFDDRLLPVFGACVERNDCAGWPRFERIVLIGDESIYGESRYNRLAEISLAPTFRLCGVRLGTDKLTHLFSNGFFYWNAGRMRGSPIRSEADARRLALDDEDALMGARSTGVSSPADAEASVAGYRFASSWFEGNDPVFARGRTTGTLVRRRAVDVCRFVTTAWDEAIDPPAFTEGAGARRRIEKAIAERVAANARGDRLSDEEKRRLERTLTARALPPDHGRPGIPDKLWIAVKWGFAYVTIPKESRRAIRALAFPDFHRGDRRSIRLARAPGYSADRRSLDEDLVDETPLPGLVGLERLDDGMPGRPEVAGRVPVLRVVAAADVAAVKAAAQVHPGVAHPEALFASLRFRRRVVGALQVRAGFRHGHLLSSASRSHRPAFAAAS
jgi:hypothetical protein